MDNEGNIGILGKNSEAVLRKLMGTGLQVGFHTETLRTRFCRKLGDAAFCSPSQPQSVEPYKTPIEHFSGLDRTGLPTKNHENHRSSWKLQLEIFSNECRLTEICRIIPPAGGMKDSTIEPTADDSLDPKELSEDGIAQENTEELGQVNMKFHSKNSLEMITVIKDTYLNVRIYILHRAPTPPNS
ncbi:hypothetical protein JTB14_030724 [Gonioctena quinquepunctata]|nr:hypothetical protein JTB14_030724 [Gonioctena quinquepunctata]